jgi:hypothetical protein
MQLIPFVCAFYAFESPLFYSHYNREGDVIVNPFAMGTHGGDLVGGAPFTVAHFRALHSAISHFPSCIFPSIIVDTHIINLPFIVSFAYKHFQTEFCA